MRAMIRRFFMIALMALCASAPAHAQRVGPWQHAVTVYGAPKYGPGFSAFNYVNARAPKGGTLKLAYLSAFDSLNPYILKGVAAPGMASFVFQSLMEPSFDEPQTYYALIAQSVRLATNRSFMDVRINPKARFSDGEKITSRDVVFSLDMMKHKSHPAYRIFYKPIEKAVALGTYEVRFYFEDAQQRELPLMVASLPVFPKHYFKKRDFEKTTLEPMVGSGPYVVSKVVPGRTLTLKRDENYWAAGLGSQRGRYNFDVIRFDVYRDDVVALEAIKSGQVDYYEEYIARNFATAYDIPAVRRGDLLKLKIDHKIPRGMQAFMFNTRRDKFSDARVREAISLTMDYEWMNKRLFYDAYTRSESFFPNTPFDAEGLPSAAEKALLAPFKNDVPKRVYTTDYKAPTTDGTGYARATLIRAQRLLDDAGWIMKDGKRTHAETGEVLTIEFLMRQRTFERVVGIMRKNLERLGIASTFRYVDDSQYQKRVDMRDFDIVSIWWNQGLHYPGNEQYAFWHSSQADVKGSQNLGGIKNKAVDALVERIARAHSVGDLRPAARALDRVLLWEHYVIPHWNLSAWRIIHWDKFAKPKVQPDYNIGLDAWWMKPLSEQPVITDYIEEEEAADAPQEPDAFDALDEQEAEEDAKAATKTKGKGK